MARTDANLKENNFPNELNKFNWGAFLLSWIWGVMHKKYVTLWILPSVIIPFIGPLALAIWFGIAGNKWAWESKQWASVEEFNEAQKFWVRLWLVLFISSIIILIKLFIFFAIIGSVET